LGNVIAGRGSDGTLFQESATGASETKKHQLERVFITPELSYILVDTIGLGKSPFVFLLLCSCYELPFHTPPFGFLIITLLCLLILNIFIPKFYYLSGLTNLFSFSFLAVQ
jgi:hypothetical protein